jgi:hypothetical protein
VDIMELDRDFVASNFILFIDTTTQIKHNNLAFFFG